MKGRVRHSARGHRGYWVPGTAWELRRALREIGVTRISGRPLGRVRKAQLAAVWCAMMERGREGEDGGSDGYVW